MMGTWILKLGFTWFSYFDVSSENHCKQTITSEPFQGFNYPSLHWAIV